MARFSAALKAFSFASRVFCCLTRLALRLAYRLRALAAAFRSISTSTWGSPHKQVSLPPARKIQHVHADCCKILMVEHLLFDITSSGLELCNCQNNSPPSKHPERISTSLREIKRRAHSKEEGSMSHDSKPRPLEVMSNSVNLPCHMSVLLALHAHQCYHHGS